MTQALGNEEHSGRVRGKGSYVTHSKYFTTPKNKTKILADEEVAFLRNKTLMLEKSLATLITQVNQLQRQSIASPSIAQNQVDLSLGTPQGSTNEFTTPSPRHVVPLGDPSPIPQV